MVVEVVVVSSGIVVVGSGGNVEDTGEGGDVVTGVSDSVVVEVGLPLPRPLSEINFDFGHLPLSGLGKSNLALSANNGFKDSLNIGAE